MTVRSAFPLICGNCRTPLGTASFPKLAELTAAMTAKGRDGVTAALQLAFDDRFKPVVLCTACAAAAKRPPAESLPQSWDVTR